MRSAIGITHTRPRDLAPWASGATSMGGVLFAALLSACAAGPRSQAPPTHFSGPVAPVGFSATVRSLGVDRSFYLAHAQEMRERLERAADGGPLNILALSGGGAGGAFGAGALIGLTQRGERPQFALVTGVSTGALLAPFAFLGPDWDEQLREVFISGRAELLLRSRGLGVFFQPGVYKGGPLVELVEHIVTTDMIKAIALESARGRSLLVATTDLDKEETVIWDLGAIAAQGGGPALKLFRAVLVASASIPGIFPPVLIHVEGTGVSYDEMHVDGGTTVPFFFLPEIAELLPASGVDLRGANLYVIINGQFSTLPHTTPERVIPILARSFSAELGHSSRISLALAAAYAQRHEMHFRFTDIPIDYPYKGALDFHRASMQPLFDYAQACAIQSQLWTTPDQALVSSERALSSAPDHNVQCPLPDSIDANPTSAQNQKK